MVRGGYNELTEKIDYLVFIKFRCHPIPCNNCDSFLYDNHPFNVSLENVMSQRKCMSKKMNSQAAFLACILLVQFQDYKSGKDDMQC